MDRKKNATKELFVDLAVKSYQIFLATLVVGPFVTTRFNPSLFIFGLILSAVCVFLSYLMTKSMQEGD